jgi:hypothetical protein
MLLFVDATFLMKWYDLTQRQPDLAKAVDCVLFSTDRPDGHNDNLLEHIAASIARSAFALMKRVKTRSYRYMMTAVHKVNAQGAGRDVLDPGNHIDKETEQKWPSFAIEPLLDPSRQTVTLGVVGDRVFASVASSSNAKSSPAGEPDPIGHYVTRRRAAGNRSITSDKIRAMKQRFEGMRPGDDGYAETQAALETMYKDMLQPDRTDGEAAFAMNHLADIAVSSGRPGAAAAGSSTDRL